MKKQQEILDDLYTYLTLIISETNGIALKPTLKLLLHYFKEDERQDLHLITEDFLKLIDAYHHEIESIHKLLNHPVSTALRRFFKNFPLHFKEEHIHLTGSLDANFIYPYLMKLLSGPHKSLYESKIRDVYGHDAFPIHSAEDIHKLISIKDDEGFYKYLKILYLPKLILLDRETHKKAAYHMAKQLYERDNVGSIRLKFSYSRATTIETDQIPGISEVDPEDVVLGLYEGFREFQNEKKDFKFILSPSFRKEPDFYDNIHFASKKDHFEYQVKSILTLLDKNPFLKDVLNEVDTVGDEKNLYRKEHFVNMQIGFRRLAAQGFRICSHHGEMFYTLKKGIQAVDNAMNIWRIDTLEHGLSLGINPNYYYHMLFQKATSINKQGIPIDPQSNLGRELMDMNWQEHQHIRDHLFRGEILSKQDITRFVKIKYHHSQEVEYYQHDVLNRVIGKGVSLTALPSSNKMLTGYLPGYKDHPFSWWEKKGITLGVGTDNHVTLQTDFIREMMILLLSEPDDLKITKLLMIATGEKRRPHISKLLWDMRQLLSPLYEE